MLFGHPTARYKRVIFTLPDGNGSIIDEFMDQHTADPADRTLSLSVQIFCLKMATASERWVIDNLFNAVVLKNMPNLVTLRPDGLAPHIVGFPIIA